MVAFPRFFADQDDERRQDLATALGAAPLPETLRRAKKMVHLATKGAGRYSFGLFGTIANYSDHDGIRALVAEAKLHGFDGATCIHPGVVPLLNDGFNVSIYNYY